jgi:uncharacterized protein (DUF1684 family)
VKFKTILLFLLAATVVAVIIYTLGGGESLEEYRAQLQKERKDKNDFMRSSEESPFVVGKLKFDSLRYFPADLKYRINASLEPIQNKKVVTLPASDGAEAQYKEYAHAVFSLDGVECKLLILEIFDMGPTSGTLFLAFADETSADETYGAGRYLEVRRVPGAASILLDFNKAYNPYCAYVDSFSCPFPPKENMLKVAIRAGEKKYKE